MSRRPQEKGCINYKSHVDLDKLPCGGCKYCTRFHNKWRPFELNIDNMVKELDQVNIIDTSGICGMEIEEIKEEQGEDKDLLFLRDFLGKGEIPSNQTLMLGNREQKIYFAERDLFEILNGVIFKKENEFHSRRVVVPEKLKIKVLNLCHDKPSAAHQGLERTKYRIKKSYYWISMGKEIKNYVEGCSICNINKTGNRKNKHELISNHAGIVMEKCHIDFMGPYPTSKRGNTCILVFIDQFSKWIEILPLENQEAETTARALVEQVFTRFGYPQQIVIKVPILKVNYLKN